jgi:AcrR family transcriptional regulator
MAGKSAETRDKILDTALELFRQEGFEAATMRAIAQRAGVATGAAYYYYPSKEAIVLDYYERVSREMAEQMEGALMEAGGLEERLRAMIRIKLSCFSPNRSVLRALLRNGADPAERVSPFSEATREIRERDTAWFRGALEDSGLRIPRDLAPHLPHVLWLYQMGVIYFWVLDDSPSQQRTELLLDRSARVVAGLVRLATLPLTRPLRRVVVELIEIVRGGQA